MVVPLPKDGVSITGVEINEAKHLICTMSDGSEIDAGKVGGLGGGLVQKPNFASLTYPGEPNTLYMTLDTESIYYWDSANNLYKPAVTNGIKDEDLTSVDLLTGTIEFDGEQYVFDAPADNVKLNIYVNGMYLTEDIDYTIDRNVTPNKIEFIDLWEEYDYCTITWIKGNILDPGELEKVQLSQLKTDITNIFNAYAFIPVDFIKNADDTWPATITLPSAKVLGAAGPLLDEQKPFVKIAYVTDQQKVVGLAVSTYKDPADEYDLILTKFGEGSGGSLDASLAKKEDIDKLFDNLGDIEIDGNDVYAKKSDIDALFNNGAIDTSTSSLATKQDIDKLFS